MTGFQAALEADFPFITHATERPLDHCFDWQSHEAVMRISSLLSFVAILGYLALRFEWRFATAAVIATMHDVLVTLGFLAVTRTEISLGTVAAVLTVLGYSMHDTIIVFDRVREDLAKPRHGRSFIAHTHKTGRQIVDMAMQGELLIAVLDR